MAEEEGGAEDTSFLRTVSTQSFTGETIWPAVQCEADLAESFAGVDKFYSLALLTINSGRDDSGDINVFTLPSQNTQSAEQMIVWWRGKKSS